MALNKKTIVDGESSRHEHLWFEGRDHSSESCSCGFIRVNEEEYQMRVSAWKSYFELVKTTPAYLNYLAMFQAFKGHNMEEMERLREELNQLIFKARNAYGDEIVELKDSLPRPNFLDPSTWTKYEIVNSP